MSRDDQKAIIETIVNDHDILDEWMLVSQGSSVGWAALQEAIKTTTNAAASGQ